MKDDGKKSSSFGMGVFFGLLIGLFSLPALFVVTKLFFGVDLLDLRQSFAKYHSSYSSSTSDPSISTSQQRTKLESPQMIALTPPNQIKSANLEKSQIVDMKSSSIFLETKRENRVPVRSSVRPPSSNITSTSSSSSSSFSSSSSMATSSSSTAVSLSSSQPIRVSRATCKFKFGRRAFLPETARRLPPMLYTFPGSGNTWSRLLIEYSTGVLTGSVYNDRSLLEELPGEFTCSWIVSAVKVHPHTHDFEDLRAGRFPSDDNKCNRGNVRKFERAILLLRNPYDSIWSEYQRRLTQSHVSGIPKAGFDWHRWQANAASLANMYHLMWSVHHAGIKRHFKPADYLFVKYELLKDPSTRRAELRKVLDFLRIDQSQRQKGETLQPFSSVRGAVTEEQLECAFILAESKRAHRTRSTLAYKPTAEGKMLFHSVETKEQEELFMTKELAYTKPLICRMWALFGRFAAEYGYTPYRNTDCSGNNAYEPIRMVNVGPQGEYNRKWVSPGQKMIDFGGYNKSDYLPNSNPHPIRNPNPNLINKQFGGIIGGGGAAGLGLGGKRRRKRLGGAGLGQPPLGMTLKEAEGAGLGRGVGVGQQQAPWKDKEGKGR